jgi:hypothetical protein
VQHLGNAMPESYHYLISKLFLNMSSMGSVTVYAQFACQLPDENVLIDVYQATETFFLSGLAF